MSKQLSKEEIIALARLSRLKLTDAEVEQYQKELSSIIGYIDQLSGADTEGLRPTSQVTGLENVSREDEVKELTASPDDLLDVAPNRQERFIKVRRMI